MNSSGKIIEQINIVALILNYNSGQDTISYVNNLFNQKGINLSVLIVDNCSTDNSLIILRKYFSNIDKVDIIKTEYNGGYAYGNNYGLKYLKNFIECDSFILISNNDIELFDEYLLKKLVIKYNSLNDIAFISPVMYVNGKPAPNCAWKIPPFKYDILTILPFIDKSRVYRSVLYNLPDETMIDYKVDCLPGSFFLGKFHVFNSIDFFDERTFLFGEERILAHKVKNHGLSNYLALSLKYNHNASSTISKEIDPLKKIKLVLNGRIIFHKYYATTKKLKLYMLIVIYNIYIFAKKIQRSNNWRFIGKRNVPLQ
jgi:hypothetical protein